MGAPSKSRLDTSLIYEFDDGTVIDANLAIGQDDAGVDLTLVRGNLDLTPLERLSQNQDWIEGVAVLRRAFDARSA